MPLCLTPVIVSLLQVLLAQCGSSVSLLRYRPASFALWAGCPDAPQDRGRAETMRNQCETDEDGFSRCVSEITESSVRVNPASEARGSTIRSELAYLEAALGSAVPKVAGLRRGRWCGWGRQSRARRLPPLPHPLAGACSGAVGRDRAARQAAADLRSRGAGAEPAGVDKLRVHCGEARMSSSSRSPVTVTVSRPAITC